MIPFIYNSIKHKIIYQKAGQWLPGVKKMGSGGRGITKGNEKTFGGDAYIYHLDCDEGITVYTCIKLYTLCTLYYMADSPQ